MANVCGRTFYNLDCCQELTFGTIAQFLCGGVSTGAWLILSNIGDLKLEILSTLAQTVKIILFFLHTMYYIIFKGFRNSKKRFPEE